MRTLRHAQQQYTPRPTPHGRHCRRGGRQLVPRRRRRVLTKHFSSEIKGYALSLGASLFVLGLLGFSHLAMVRLGPVPLAAGQCRLSSNGEYTLARRAVGRQRPKRLLTLRVPRSLRVSETHISMVAVTKSGGIREGLTRARLFTPTRGVKLQRASLEGSVICNILRPVRSSLPSCCRGRALPFGVRAPEFVD